MLSKNLHVLTYREIDGAVLNLSNISFLEITVACGDSIEIVEIRGIGVDFFIFLTGSMFDIAISFYLQDIVKEFSNVI